MTVLAIGLMAGCQGASVFETPAQFADRLAERSGMKKKLFVTTSFTITGYVRRSAAPSRLLAVYLEGDGRAWLGRYRLAPDPSPRNPMALRLAVQHRADPVVYLARPCQFTVAATSRGCRPEYWAGRRYAPEVVAAVDEAIDQALALTGARRLLLVGYSGGGAIASLVAAGRDDVDRVVTVAGTLDHEAWTEFHGVSPLRGSLNPAATKGLRDVPQIHFVGADDDVVPPLVARSYLARLGRGANARLIVVPGYTHRCCWVENWPELLSRIRSGR